MWDFYDITDSYSIITPFDGYRWYIHQIIIEPGVTSIGSNAFDGCLYLTTVSLPSTLVSIGERAISSCESLKEITVPEGVVSMGRGCFSYNLGLEVLNLPSTLSTFDAETVQACSELKTINISKSNPYFVTEGGIVFNKSMDELICCPSGLPIDDYTVPSTVREICQGAFAFSRIKSIELPESVETIGKGVFFRSELVSLSYPVGNATFQHSLFRDCRSLRRVYAPGVTQLSGELIFSDCAQLEELVLGVPLESIDERNLWNCSKLN